MKGCLRVALVAMCIFSYSASAEMTAKEFISLYEKGNQNDKNYLVTIIGAVYNGISWVEIELRTERNVCPPIKLAFTNEQIFDILKRKAAADDLVAQQPYGLAMLLAVKDAFPCPQISN